MRTLLVTAMKDEGPALLEWLAHARVLGFDDILIYQNDSSDFSPAMLEHLAAQGLVHYRDLSGKPGRPQINATRDAAASDLYRAADWCFFIDCDEFFVPHGAETAEAFLSAYDQAEAIAINWLTFGSSGRQDWEPGLTIDRFKRCARRNSGRNAGFKSFHRPGAGFSGFGIHRPWAERPRDTFVYPDHSLVPAELQMGAVPHLAETLSVHLEGAQLNHYAAKSRAEFDRKLARGRGAGPSRDYPAEKFDWFDVNDAEDDRIGRFRDAIATAYAALLADPILAWLHQRSLVHHFGAAAEV